MEDGLKLMVVGMGTVFFFLALMVIIIGIAAKLLAPFAGLLEAPASAKKAPRKKAVAQDDTAVIAAITSAVHQHRNKNK